MMIDLIVDFLICICNVNMVCYDLLEVFVLKIKCNIVEILKNEGFVCDVEYIDDDKQGIICVFLKYGKDNECVISGLKCILKLGLCLYVKVDVVFKVLNGLGIVIILILEGVIIDKEVCVKKFGGEVLVYVW